MGGMEKVKAGDLGVCIPVDNKDEVGEAQKTFNTMTMQLREQICQITHEQQLIADTEMKAIMHTFYITSLKRSKCRPLSQTKRI